MPRLDTTLHLDMYRSAKTRRAVSSRLKQALNVLLDRSEVYGLEWGDPAVSPPLAHVRDHFPTPYITPETIALEIGPGGGRWTRYMLGARTLYAVDFHSELLDELRSNFKSQKVILVKNHGTDFPGIQPQSIDFVFSFGTFVHLDRDIIGQYLQNLRPILTSRSNVVIQYSDKTKPLGKSNDGFSDNDPEAMRRLVLSHGYVIHEEDVATLWHSAVIRFGTGEAHS